MLSAIYFLPLEIYDWFKNNVLAGKSAYNAIAAIITIAAIAGFISTVHRTADKAKTKSRFNRSGSFGTLHGSFSGLITAFVFNENGYDSSSILASMQTGTVISGIEMRNKDLREKEQWLDTKKYPMISFHSMKIVKTSTGYKAIEYLTRKNFPKPAEIPFIFKDRGKEGVFKGKSNIRRHNFM